MPFKRGIAPIRRTINYLQANPLVFKDKVKIMTVNYNEKDVKAHDMDDKFAHHKGAQDFVFWNLPQIQYKNPNVQIAVMKNLTPSPFITCFLESGEKVYFDVDSQTNKEITNRLVKTLGKSEEVLAAEALASEKKDNPANFGVHSDRQCICQIPGQVPCPGLVPVPKHWRGKYVYGDEDDF